MSDTVLIICKIKALADQIGRGLSSAGLTDWGHVLESEDGLELTKRLNPACIILDVTAVGADLVQYCIELSKINSSPIVLTYSPTETSPNLLKEVKLSCEQVVEFFETPLQPELIAKSVLQHAKGPNSQKNNAENLPIKPPQIKSQPSKPSPPPTMKNQTNHQWLKANPEVTGYALITKEGSLLEFTGKANAEYCGVINYLLNIGQAIGSELGLDNLSETQIYGKESRILNTAIVGGSVTLVTTPKIDLKSVATKLQEGLL